MYSFSCFHTKKCEILVELFWNDIIAFEDWKFPTICQFNKLKILIEIF